MSLRAEAKPAGTGPSFGRRWIAPISATLLIVAITTACLWYIQTLLQKHHLVFLYFVPIALIALRYGSMSAMGAAVASTLAAACFLYAPRFSFAIQDPLQLMELVLFSMLALLASQVVSGMAGSRAAAGRRPTGAPRASGPVVAWRRRLRR